MSALPLVDVAQTVADVVQAFTRRSVDPAAYPNGYASGSWTAPGVTALRDTPAVGRACANLAAWPGCPDELHADMLLLAGHALDQALATQGEEGAIPGLSVQPAGRAVDVDAGIGLTNAAEITLRLAGMPGVRAGVVDALARAGTRMWSGPGGLGSPQPWYVNGNVALTAALAYWLLFRLTEEQVWRDRFSSQWSYCLQPRAGRAQPGVDLAAFGWRVTGTQPAPDAPTGTWADIVGYLGEAGPSGVVGPDYDYGTYHLEILARLLVATEGWPEQARVVKVANAATNWLLARTNTSSTLAAGVPAWVLDGRGGTRHGHLLQLRAPTMWWLTARGARPDLDPGWPAAQWTATLRPFWTGGTGEVTSAPYDATLYGRLADLSTVLLIQEAA